jgi:hypothetical protein
MARVSAREEIAWSRRFETALALDSDHEDAGGIRSARWDRHGALTAFEQILVLGWDDHERCCRSAVRSSEREFSRGQVLRVRGERSTRLCRGVRLRWLRGTPAERRKRRALLRRALQIDPHYSEADLSANMLYDRGETEAALHHLHQTVPRITTTSWASGD